jgi:hypothetical protein
MKQLVVLSVVLFSLVFADFGFYIPVATPIAGMGGALGQPAATGVPIGFIWQPDAKKVAPLDVQFSLGGADEDYSGINKGASFLYLQGTFYLLSRGDISVGGTAIYDSASADGDTATDLKIGGSAKWKINNLFALKSDVIAFTTRSGHKDYKGTSFFAWNEARISLLVNLF